VSLRTRLLIAIGVIALVALAIANVATYSALQSFLYQRVDQQLDQQHPFFERLADDGEPITQFCHRSAQPAPGGGSGAPGSPVAGPNSNLPPNLFPVLAVEVLTRSGETVNGQVCPAYSDNVAYTPRIPTPIPGLPAPTSGGNNTAVRFVAPSTQPDGPSFRVRASALTDGNVLIVAQPLQSTDETLHRLHRELSGIKESAFHYVEGHETTAEAFEAILLAHIADVRASLAELHGRARRPGEPPSQQPDVADDARERTGDGEKPEPF